MLGNMEINTVSFWKSLLDFISVELRGFPPTNLPREKKKEDTKKQTTKEPEKPATNEPPRESDSGDEGLDETINSIPQNALGHMIRLPKRLEGMMCYSLLLCLDALLFEMTLMPLQSIGVIVFLVQKGTKWLISSASSLLESCLYPASLKKLYKVNRRELFSRSIIPPSIWLFEKGNKAHKQFSVNKTTEPEPPEEKNEQELTHPGVTVNKEHQTGSIDESTNFLSDLHHFESIDVEQEEENYMLGSGYGPQSLEILPPWMSKLSRSHATKRCKKFIESDSYSVNPSEVCGFMRFLTLILAVLILSNIDTSRVYHNIRGQPFIKLYVIFNMLEISERLCRSFGRDCTDILMHSSLRVLKWFSRLTKQHEKKKNTTHLKKSQSISSEASETKGENDVVQSDKHPARETILGEIRRLSIADDISLINPINDKYYTPLMTSLDEGTDCFTKFMLPTTFPYYAGSTSGSSTDSKFKLYKDPDSNWNISGRLKRNSHDNSSSQESLKLKKQGENEKGNNGNTQFAETAPSAITAKSQAKEELPVTLFQEILTRYFLVAVYILFHSFMHLVRVLSLNIAINSSESAMFLLLVTNNFAEIKSTVFKKYNNISLFSVVANDAVERFHLCFDSMLVFFKMSTVESPLKSYWKVSRWFSMMFGLEVLIDYFKQSFLLKYNSLDGEVHKRYTDVLMADVLLSRCQLRQEELIDFNFKIPCRGAYAFPHIPARRLGFMPSPMLTLIICNVPFMRNGLNVEKFIAAACIWLSFFLLKITTSILLVAHAISRQEKLKKLKAPMDTVCAL